jgi:hypothetical protein
LIAAQRVAESSSKSRSFGISASRIDIVLLKILIYRLHGNICCQAIFS